MKNPKWTKEKLDLVKKYLEMGTNVREISTSLKVSFDSVNHAIRRYNLRAGVKSSKQNPGKTFIRANKELIYELKSQLDTATPLKRKITKEIIKKGDTLVIHFTDWHIGKVVKNEAGLELYNTTIFKERIQKLNREMLRLLDDYIRKGTPIKDVIIISTGDILDGMGIYASQETQSELSPPFQVMLGVETIQSFILALLERKLNVSFYGCKGNHGEIRGERGKAKDPNANWDLQLYLILDFWAKQVLKNENVKIFYSELNYLNFEVQGWKYHIRHIAPQQSETSAGKAKFLGWAREHNCDVLVYGHYHHYGITDRSGVTVIKGGSIVGADEFAEQLAEESEPIQLIWGVSSHRPTTFIYAIDLGKRKKI